ncbi:DUF3541 domain-containing protein [Enterovibrio sp. Hal110]
MMKKWRVLLTSALVMTALPACSLTPQYHADSTAFGSVVQMAEINDAREIRDIYDRQLGELSPYQLGHYGLRMYRQTQDDYYKGAVWTDMARVASRLNAYAADIDSQADVERLGKVRLSHYGSGDSERDALRQKAGTGREEYLVLGAGLISSMARANEYGLAHIEDEKLREVLGWYDFSVYVSNPEMIRAWAAQLANQVYWLKQLGEDDLTKTFESAFRETYPDGEDAQLSTQQFNNKLYGMTHIILAASEYYRVPVSESDYAWIYTYYRDNIDTILARSKPDVVAEIGISFLLAGLDDDPVVERARAYVREAISEQAGIVPSVSGSVDLAKGEHRNVLAIMLLDWQGANAVPMAGQKNGIVSSVPWGLVPKAKP